MKYSLIIAALLTASNAYKLKQKGAHALDFLDEHGEDSKAGDFTDNDEAKEISLTSFL